MSNWNKVVFSDKSKFNLFVLDGHKYCWRRPGEEFEEKNTTKIVKHGGGNIMVWGCITSHGVGQLYHIEGTVNSQVYVEILNKALLGTIKDYKINKTMS